MQGRPQGRGGGAVCKIEGNDAENSSTDRPIDPVHLCASIYSSITLSVYLSIYLSVHPSIYVSVCQSIHPSTIDRFISPFFHLSISLALHLYIYLAISGYLCNRLSVFVYLSIDRSIHRSIYLAIYISISPSLDPFIDLWIYVPIFNLSIYPSSCLLIQRCLHLSIQSILLKKSDCILQTSPCWAEKLFFFVVAGHVA